GPTRQGGPSGTSPTPGRTPTRVAGYSSGCLVRPGQDQLRVRHPVRPRGPDAGHALTPLAVHAGDEAVALQLRHDDLLVVPGSRVARACVDEVPVDRLRVGGRWDGQGRQVRPRLCD